MNYTIDFGREKRQDSSGDTCHLDTDGPLSACVPNCLFVHMRWCAKHLPSHRLMEHSYCQAPAFDGRRCMADGGTCDLLFCFVFIFILAFSS